MKKELSVCVMQKFNGYELLRNHLNSRERKKFIPIYVVYEPTLNEKKPIECFFAPKIYLRADFEWTKTDWVLFCSKIYLAFHTNIEKIRDGKKMFSHTGARQCHYCNNYFIKSAEKMEKHLSCCAGQAGFTFSFDNEKIIDYQDHFKNSGDLPFTIYYDFVTTTGRVVFFDAKMFVVSYCMIVAFQNWFQNGI